MASILRIFKCLSNKFTKVKVRDENGKDNYLNMKDMKNKISACLDEISKELNAKKNGGKIHEQLGNISGYFGKILIARDRNWELPKKEPKYPGLEKLKWKLDSRLNASNLPLINRIVNSLDVLSSNENVGTGSFWDKSLRSKCFELHSKISPVAMERTKHNDFFPLNGQLKPTEKDLKLDIDPNKETNIYDYIEKGKFSTIKEAIDSLLQDAANGSGKYKFLCLYDRTRRGNYVLYGVTRYEPEKHTITYEVLLDKQGKLYVVPARDPALLKDVQSSLNAQKLEYEGKIKCDKSPCEMHIVRNNKKPAKKSFTFNDSELSGSSSNDIKVKSLRSAVTALEHQKDIIEENLKNLNKGAPKNVTLPPADAKNLTDDLSNTLEQINNTSEQIVEIKNALEENKDLSPEDNNTVIADIKSITTQLKKVKEQENEIKEVINEKEQQVEKITNDKALSGEKKKEKIELIEKKAREKIKSVKKDIGTTFEVLIEEMKCTYSKKKKPKKPTIFQNDDEKKYVNSTPDPSDPNDRNASYPPNPFKKDESGFTLLNDNNDEKKFVNSTPKSSEENRQKDDSDMKKNPYAENRHGAEGNENLTEHIIDNSNSKSENVSGTQNGDPEKQQNQKNDKEISGDEWINKLKNSVEKEAKSAGSYNQRGVCKYWYADQLLFGLCISLSKLKEKENDPLIFYVQNTDDKKLGETIVKLFQNIFGSFYKSYAYYPSYYLDAKYATNHPGYEDKLIDYDYYKDRNGGTIKNIQKIAEALKQAAKKSTSSDYFLSSLQSSEILNSTGTDVGKNYTSTDYKKV